jgi:NAD(P)-dependent dehydrogenase (short-subunit alcohol dehydrogenase family)
MSDLQWRRPQPPRATSPCTSAAPSRSSDQGRRHRVDQVVATYGRLDVAFNNAGIEQSHTTTADTTEADFDKLMAVNVRSVFVGLKHQIPLMLASGDGTIVNTSSGAGVIGIAQ